MVDIQKIISRILQKDISIEELEEFKKSLKSDPELKKTFKKELGLFMALKNLEDLEMEKIIENYKFRPPPDIEIER